ncbi:hypothetical protein GH714_017667 [Hevea brasiliensis]|uniref:Receptor ligand binding region domain-containing protein n=1 Tax=Hevea brasiliensis TaxID=3981 RepID=A0A6A6LL47_HEVBR|nr:hypothetical protein GH714_017667 [Hevea brasiliensis]
MWWSCINMSLSDFYTTHSHYKTRLELHPRDSIRDVLGAAAAAIGTRVSYWSAISPLASDEQIEEELYKLMTMEVTVFIVHLFPSLGSRFFTKVKQVGMLTEGYVWILTDGMVDLLSASDPSVLDSMQGVLGVKPYVPNTIEIENFRVQWKKNFYRDNPDMVDAELSINGLWLMML